MTIRRLAAGAVGTVLVVAGALWLVLAAPFEPVTSSTARSVTTTPTPTATPTPTQALSATVTVTVTVTREVLPPPTYDFTIPVGGTSYWTVEGAVYGDLIELECAAAQTQIPYGDTSARARWRQFPEPRYLMIYQAAIDLCAGNRDHARRLLDHVAHDKTAYPTGWAGLGWATADRLPLYWHVCEVYKAVVSTVRQRPKDGVPCRRQRGSRATVWPADRSDPRHAVR